MSVTNKQFAQGLRELADLYDSNQSMPIPELLDIFLGSGSRQVLADAVKALASGGKVDKMPPDSSSEYFFRIRRVMPSGLTVQLTVPRADVCRRVTKSVIVETWECPDSLLNPDAEGVTA